MSSHGYLDNYKLVKKKIEELPPAKLKPPRLITGSDLIAAGYQPGPAFSRILAAVEDAQLESKIDSREEAMALVHAQFPLE